MVSSKPMPKETHSNFYLLKENGLFKTPITPHKLSLAPFRGATSEELTKFRIMRAQLLSLLGITSLGEIADVKADPEMTRKTSRLLAGTYGIEGSNDEVSSTLNVYAQTADKVIEDLRNGVLSDFQNELEMVNEVASTNNPIDLILMAFNDKYSPKARFEAKRKLTLMKLAGAIDYRERELHSEEKFGKFLKFLNENIWSPKTKIGDAQSAYLLSTHDEKDFSCVSVEVLTKEEADKIKETRYQKITPIRRRTFLTKAGKEIPIYVTTRQKTQEAKILKLLRKGDEHPASAVDDDLGLMAVLNDVSDIDLFQEHLIDKGPKSGSMVSIEDVSDNLTEGAYKAENIGSSSAIQFRKFFIVIHGMRVELIMNTNQSFVDYNYKRGVSHREYEVKRLLDSGVIQLLFPEDLYGIDMKKIKSRLINKARKQIEED